MDRRFLLVTVFVTVLAVGCQHGRDAYMVEVFNAQNLILEDKIYELNDRIDELEARLSARTNRVPRRIDEEEEAADADSSSEPSSEMSPEDELPDLTPPDVDPGTPTEPEGLPDPDDASTGPSLHKNASHISQPADREVVTISVSPETRITNDGAVIVIEAKNRDGQAVAVPAKKISMGVRNPQTKERFGEWYFEDEESVAKQIRVVHGRPALVFQVQWSKAVTADELELGVVYEKHDGQKLKALAPLTTRSQHHVADRWERRAKTAPAEEPTPTSPAARPEIDEGPGADVYR